MKKNFCSVITILSVVFNIFFMIGCETESLPSEEDPLCVKIEGDPIDWSSWTPPWHPGGLSEEIQLRIRQDYLDKLHDEGVLLNLTTDDVSIIGYYGTYISLAGTDSVVVMMEDGRNWVPNQRDVAVADFYLFRYKNDNSILAWNEGQFYSLPVAWELDIVRRLRDWDRIFNLHNGFSIETEERIWGDYMDWRQLAGNPVSQYAQTAVRFNYLGTFNEWAVTYITFGPPNVGMDPQPFFVDGIVFRYMGFGDHIVVWKDGQIYEFRDAYNQDILSFRNMQWIGYYFFPTVNEKPQ